MPLGPRSRYLALPVSQAADRTGALHPTVPMRLLSPLDPQAGNFRHTVAGLQPLEYLAFKYLGSSDMWWRIADTNEARFPLDWLTGDVVTIPGTNQTGLIVRTRSF